MPNLQKHHYDDEGCLVALMELAVFLGREIHAELAATFVSRLRQLPASDEEIIAACKSMETDGRVAEEIRYNRTFMLNQFVRAIREHRVYESLRRERRDIKPVAAEATWEQRQELFEAVAFEDLGYKWVRKPWHFSPKEAGRLAECAKDMFRSSKVWQGSLYSQDVYILAPRFRTLKVYRQAIEILREVEVDQSAWLKTGDDTCVAFHMSRQHVPEERQLPAPKPRRTRKTSRNEALQLLATLDADERDLVAGQLKRQGVL